jgi:hypothetical protein
MYNQIMIPDFAGLMSAIYRQSLRIRELHEPFERAFWLKGKRKLKTN